MRKIWEIFMEFIKADKMPGLRIKNALHTIIYTERKENIGLNSILVVLKSKIKH